MIKVVGLWELGWNTPIKEIELWEYPLRDYGVDVFHMAPITGIRSDFVQEVQELPLLLDSEREAGRTIVFLDEAGSEDLSLFVHPENVTYVFGKASLSPMRAYGKEGDRSVRITTPKQSGLLWPHQAAVLVLHDRMLKR